MALKGKFIRREGTAVIFGSQKRPEWKPIDLSGSVDPSGLVPGSYYEIETQGNTLLAYRQLGDRPQTPSAPSGAPISANQHQGGTIPPQSLMASATGFAKSAMESKLVRTPEEAAKVGLAWAQTWRNGLPPMRAPEPEAPPATAPPPEEEDVPW